MKSYQLDVAVRAAAFAFLVTQRQLHGAQLTWSVLAKGFAVLATCRVGRKFRCMESAAAQRPVQRACFMLARPFLLLYPVSDQALAVVAS